MTAALHILLFGAITFTAQDLADFTVDADSNEPGLTCRLADLDGNGEQDLILPTAVYFQHEGAFSDRMKAPNPSANAPADCDIWNDSLYLRLPDKLQIVRWQGEGWSVQSEQYVSWPDPGNQLMMSVYAAPSKLRFERFLHDMNGDGTPEIVVPTERGLSVYRAGSDGSYERSAELDVFPPLQLAGVEGRQLWPETARAVTFPARTMSCRYNVNGNRISVITREAARKGGVAVAGLECYRVKRFSVSSDTLQIVPGETREEISEPFAPHLRLVRLNGDDVIDIGGGDWQTTQSAPLPTPIYETRASTDGGKTFRTMRVTGFRPNQSFIDVNHDGRTDVVTESTGLFDGGLRESLSRFCTSKQIKHEVHVYLQDAAGQFGQKPDLSGVFDIELDAAPIRGGVVFNRYQSGELFNVTGDFNGDGFNDALVRDRPGRLALHAGTPDGFDTRSSGSVPVENLSRFTVDDYNGDGRADISVQWYDANDPDPKIKTKLYLAREGGTS